jgi:ribosomal protein L11 methyltransferase
MTWVGCSIKERFVNPLFELFEGGDFILSSHRDIEEPLARMRIYLEDAAMAGEASAALKRALELVGIDTPIETGKICDEDWKFSYRRHFKTEFIGERLVIVPQWEKVPECDRLAIILDPGLAFGTGKHETTRACLEYIDEIARRNGGKEASFLDMGCGSGILSIAAKKLGFNPVCGFDVDQEAVDASFENAVANGVDVEFMHFGLGSRAEPAFKPADTVVANILGPLLIRFADEIVPYAKKDLVISGILTELYPEVLSAYESRGFKEVSRKTIGEWTTGLLCACK